MDDAEELRRLRVLFRWEDVDTLVDAADMLAGEDAVGWRKEIEAVRNIAERIAALLPPRET